jgi:C-terminal processing protease CtpA/Prc
MRVIRVVLLVTMLYPSTGFVPVSNHRTPSRLPTFQLDAHCDNNNWITQLTKSLVVAGLALSISSEPSLADTRKYWNAMQEGPTEERVAVNEKLLDYAVGTINTMYYDNSGGALFQPPEFYQNFKKIRDVARGTASDRTTPRVSMDTREGVVTGLKWLVGSLHDPFSKYLTREELRQELELTGKDGFLGLGAIVEAISSRPELALYYPATSNNKDLLSATRVANLPIVSAIAPDSPAERAGLTVGDRIVSIGSEKFLGYTRDEVSTTLRTKYSAENYMGHPDLTVAKPVWRTIELQQGLPTNVVVGYRSSRVRLPTSSIEPFTPEHGNNIVHYSLIKDSILSADSKVGYIRLTRFSRASTAGYLKAVTELEAEGAESFIVDVRNNYGGIIQEAMLTASTLLRDPHAVLCYTMNSRGGFTPHDAEEYIVDSRYPGYLLSKESRTVTLDQVRRENPDLVENDGINWVPPSSYASLHEQRMRRGIHIAGDEKFVAADQAKAQKKIVVLINEGTASAAEVFASSLHDNGRTVALVGTKTFGKGLIQHTFPMPDGGGLRLTVAEYLTPLLKHVTKVGSARFDSYTGAWVGGGIQPDIVCDSQQGIPGRVGADLCVGMALDALEEANNVYDEPLHPVGVQHAIRSGLERDTF